MLQQALRELSRWVEEDVAPPASTSYEVVDGQVIVPVDTAHAGHPPVVSYGGRGQRGVGATGHEFSFRAVAEVPEGAGVIVAVAWDFDGSGSFAEAEPVAPAAGVVVERRRSFPVPGTSFPAVRVVARREGTASDPFARLQNLARVRVVVSDRDGVRGFPGKPAAQCQLIDCSTWWGVPVVRSLTPRSGLSTWWRRCAEPLVPPGGADGPRSRGAAVHAGSGPDAAGSLPADKVVNRRYTIRKFDPRERRVVIDVSLHGKGPGTDWIAAAVTGDHINAIGPRGKVTLRPGADWHLFVVDETGLPGALAMIDALPAGSVATAMLEVDTAADEQEPEARHGDRVDMHWIHRSGESVPGDPAPLLQAVAGVDLPDGVGHAYVSAEAGVVPR